MRRFILSLFIVLFVGSVSAFWGFTGNAIAEGTVFADTAKCKDSDGGLFTDVAGTVSLFKKQRGVYVPKKKYVDSCTGSKKMFEGERRSSKIAEYYCKNGVAKKSVRSCTEGCVGGKCVDVIEEVSDYVVAIRLGSLYTDGALKFALAKKAKVLYYSDSLEEILSQLRLYNPNYLAVISEPEYLTPDFIDDADIKSRKIDNDPYVDLALGFITARSKEGFDSYVDRLLAYSPTYSLKLYGINTPYKFRDLKFYSSIIFEENCLFNEDIFGSGGGFSICNNEQVVNEDRLMSNLVGANVFAFSLHGTPKDIDLGKGQKLEGGPRGAYFTKQFTSEGQSCYDIDGNYICKLDPLTDLNLPLVIAESCLTARLIGQPSSLDSRFDDFGISGKIENSLLLSLIDSGMLNYIGSSHVANSALFPEETLIQQSVLQGDSIGLALKNFKNRYIFNVEKNKFFSLSDEYTNDLVLFNVRNWVLFGDPSIILTKQTLPYTSCIQNFLLEGSSNTKTARLTLQFQKNSKIISNTEYISKIEIEKLGVFGKSGSDACAITIPYAGKLKSVLIEPTYSNTNFNQNFFYSDLGDEILLIPTSSSVSSPEGKFDLKV